MSVSKHCRFYSFILVEIPNLLFSVPLLKKREQFFGGTKFENCFEKANILQHTKNHFCLTLFRVQNDRIRFRSTTGYIFSIFFFRNQYLVCLSKQECCIITQLSSVKCIHQLDLGGDWGAVAHSFYCCGMILMLLHSFATGNQYFLWENRRHSISKLAFSNYFTL